MLQGKAILVVDDEPDLREILCDEFQLEGAEVNNAPNGQEALKKVEANPPDIVVSDLRMPGGDGVTLAKELKNRNAVSPLVVLMTGFADLTAEEAYEIGAEGFMTKPFHLESVRENLSRLLMPSRERWAQTPFKAPAKTVSESADTFRAQPASSYLARGGMFWPGERLPVRVGDEVSFDAGHHLKGTAIVRWVRSSGQNGRGPGMGLEFMSLAPESLIWVEEQLLDLKPVAFLPRGF
ncbi:MAG: response regulator [Bdellovibrionaceae bacterium]|nr:response regulator [Pseudobdellovibrionaceae bacterium]